MQVEWKKLDATRRLCQFGLNLSLLSELVLEAETQLADIYNVSRHASVPVIEALVSIAGRVQMGLEVPFLERWLPRNPEIVDVVKPEKGVCL